MSYLHLRPLRVQPSWSTWVRQAHSNNLTNASETLDANWPHPVCSSSRLTDRKSTFLAHASILPHPTALPHFLAHLRALPRTNVKRATHCMYAYRAAGVAAESDGGEGGSGDRLARLLRLTACEDVVVVVWRWYGGVKLGTDRWKRISEVAREALENGNFLVKGEGSEGQNKSRERKK
ncbi:ribosomal protein S5 domain 2-type protein [Mycena alexandri]|uniref:Ribosomal protein S5 domain 2-type protein n=1 Tax=Mycena alexandri TaxID=1745969 RepID=A0AAD6T4G0_9AGAR|nr:ribosomal protein S5 domain 2-type protein [Mycena alexandri]